MTTFICLSVSVCLLPSLTLNLHSVVMHQSLVRCSGCLPCRPSGQYTCYWWYKCERWFNGEVAVAL